MCQNYILNRLDNILDDVYSSIKSTKTLWKSLNQKHEVNDVGMKQFIVDKFFNFKMVDLKTMTSQVQEFQLILYDIHAKEMILNESFQMTTIIKKLSPS